MKAMYLWLNAAVFGFLLSVTFTSNAGIYQFQFKANPDALDAAPDHTLDVLHTVTIDSSKIAGFDATTLNSTSTWLDGGITDAMSYEGKTVTLNSGFDPLLPHPVIHGAHYDEGFLGLDGYDSIWFYALEFAPDSQFIDGNKLPYDPFVYGFLFAYQDDRAYRDFRVLWTEGQTSVLSKYEISAVPESSRAALLLTGMGLLAVARARQQKSPDRRVS